MSICLWVCVPTPPIHSSSHMSIICLSSSDLVPLIWSPPIHHTPIHHHPHPPPPHLMSPNSRFPHCFFHQSVCLWGLSYQCIHLLFCHPAVLIVQWKWCRVQEHCPDCDQCWVVWSCRESVKFSFKLGSSFLHVCSNLKSALLTLLTVECYKTVCVCATAKCKQLIL